MTHQHPELCLPHFRPQFPDGVEACLLYCCFNMACAEHPCRLCLNVECQSHVQQVCGQCSDLGCEGHPQYEEPAATVH